MLYAFKGNKQPLFGEFKKIKRISALEEGLTPVDVEGVVFDNGDEVRFDPASSIVKYQCDLHLRSMLYRAC